jgi:outer membrane protein insertion porin family
MLLSFSFIKTPGFPEKFNQSTDKVTSENRMGEITWIGNTIFSADTLNKLLGYKKGDYFSFDELSERLLKGDVSTLYFDNGNVFYKADFSANLKPNREYDIAITIYEGVQAYIGTISIKGNITVPSYEILEKVSIHSGNLFNKTKIINSVKAIAAMGKFVPEKIEPVPIPNEETRRIDLVFNVKEK